jgi:DNA repair protein RecO (recombination protein O)
LQELTVHAVVLRRRDAGESDRRLTVLTPENGKFDVIAKGARKAGSRLAGASEPLMVSVLQLAPGRKVKYVTQSQPVTSFPGLRTDYAKLSFGLALAELCAAIVPYEEPAAEPFQFVIEALHRIEAHEKPLVALIWAELKMLDMSGFAPQFDACAVSGAPVSEAVCWLSPMAGGYVCASGAERFVDRFQARAEVLYGLARISREEVPPANLKFAPESLAALMPFWHGVAECPLPANEQALAFVRDEARSASKPSTQPE